MSPLPGRQGPQAAQESPLSKKLATINHSRQDAVSVSATERRVVGQRGAEAGRGQKRALTNSKISWTVKSSRP